MAALKAAWKSLTTDKAEEYCEGEKLVRELTATDEDLPETQVLRELVYVLHDQPENYQKTYTMLMRRVTDYRYNKHMEKGLFVVEYLLKNSDERFVKSCKSHLQHFQKLKGYKYEMYGKDYGAEVRRRANRVVHFLTNDKDLQTAREEALGLPKKKVEGAEKEKKPKPKPKPAKEEEEEEEEHEHEPEPENSDAKSSEDAKTKKKEHEDSSEKEIPTTKKTKGTGETDVDPWLKDFAPDDKPEDKPAAEDGGKYTFGDFDEYEEPFDEK